jgi:glycine/D-amino acid oxidase-like deaminating enzyme
MRVAVVGAGIVGVHVGVELARRGAHVTLLEGGEPGEGTTRGSFAWIDASHPGLARYLELRLLGLEAWRRQDEALGRPWWLHLRGTTIWTSDPAAQAELEHQAQRLTDGGWPPARITPAEALHGEPDLAIPPGVEAVYRFAGEGWVHTAEAVAALLGRADADRLRLRTHAAVTELDRDGSGRVTGVFLQRGEQLGADAVVTCAGRWTQSLLSTADVHVPMLTAEEPGSRVPGLVARTTAVPTRINGVVLADGLLIRSEPGGGLLAHSEELDRTLTGEAAPPGASDELIARLADRVRGAGGARLRDDRVCLRALPGDLLPVAGWALDGLYAVATHSGVTLAPALAKLVCDEVLDGRERSELSALRPDRFGAALV